MDGCVTACVIYGRFDSTIRFENELDGQFDLRFDSNEKNDSQVPIYSCTHITGVGVKGLRPRTNIITDCMAGRLLRAYNVEFNWFKLSSWINVTEQWPYRLSWIILEVEDNPDIDDPLSLKNVYDRSSVLSVNHGPLAGFVDI